MSCLGGSGLFAAHLVAVPVDDDLRSGRGLTAQGTTDRFERADEKSFGLKVVDRDFPRMTVAADLDWRPPCELVRKSHRVAFLAKLDPQQLRHLPFPSALLTYDDTSVIPKSHQKNHDTQHTICIAPMSSPDGHPWRFLTNHTQVLLCIDDAPNARLRDVAEQVGITERAAQRILSDLVEAGYVERTRHGRRNSYRINEHRHMRHPAQEDIEIRTLLDLMRLVGDV